jgi:hypothetical protein
MAETQRVFVFHLKRANGTPLFLHPFSSPARLIELLPKARVEGRYGDEPMVESLTKLRDELYRMVDAAVRVWIGDLRFIPRFLLSAGIFLVAYFLAGYLIREPIPILPDVAIGIAAAVIGYGWLGKRYGASTAASNKRDELRAAVDRIAFTESSFLLRVELELHDSEAREAEAIRRIVSPMEHALDTAEREEAEHLVGMLERRFDLRRLRRDERVLKRFVDDGEPAASAPSIKRWLELQRLDAPLYALYKGFKRTVQSLRS